MEVLSIPQNFSRQGNMFSKNDRANPTSANNNEKATPSLISASLYIVGNLKSEGEIQVDGTVDGDVSAHSLTIGEKARVTGDLLADHVLVRGTVHGRICSRRVQLAKTARVRGDILHEVLAIDSGAFVEGHIKRTDKPTEAAVGKASAAPSGSKKAPVDGAKQTAAKQASA